MKNFVSEEALERLIRANSDASGGEAVFGTRNHLPLAATALKRSGITTEQLATEPDMIDTISNE